MPGAREQEKDEERDAARSREARAMRERRAVDDGSAPRGSGGVQDAITGAWWMPRSVVPMKDVAQPRKASGSRWQAENRGYPNGGTRPWMTRSPAGEHIAGRGAPRELKHLSTARRREYSRSSGERTGSSPNRCRAKAPAVAAAGLMGRPGAPGGARPSKKPVV